MYAMKFLSKRRSYLLMFILILPQFFQDSNAEDIRVFSTLRLLVGLISRVMTCLASGMVTAKASSSG